MFRFETENERSTKVIASEALYWKNQYTVDSLGVIGIGVSSYYLSRIEESEKEYRETTRIELEYWTAHGALISILHGKGKDDEVEDYLNKLFEIGHDLKNLLESIKREVYESWIWK